MHKQVMLRTLMYSAYYNIIEYSDIHSKRLGSLWEYYRDETALNNDDITDFSANNNNSISFKFK